jgi:hypothetical protein
MLSGANAVPITIVQHRHRRIYVYE